MSIPFGSLKYSDKLNKYYSLGVDFAMTPKEIYSLSVEQCHAFQQFKKQKIEIITRFDLIDLES